MTTRKQLENIGFIYCDSNVHYEFEGDEGYYSLFYEMSDDDGINGGKSFSFPNDKVVDNYPYKGCIELFLYSTYMREKMKLDFLFITHLLRYFDKNMSYPIHGIKNHDDLMLFVRFLLGNKGVIKDGY